MNRKMTVSYLQAQLQATVSKLESLNHERAEHMKAVRKIDREIASLRGEPMPNDSDSNTEKSGRGHGPQYTRLVEVLKDFDGKNFTPDEILSAFIKSGGPTSAKNPKGVLMQLLYQMPDVQRVSRGIYRMKDEPRDERAGGPQFNKAVEAVESFHGKEFTVEQAVKAFRRVGGKTTSDNPKDVIMKLVRVIPGISRPNRGTYILNR